MTWVCAFNLERENKVGMPFICHSFLKLKKKRKNSKLNYFHLKFNRLLSLVKLEVRGHAPAYGVECSRPWLRVLRHD